jgi:hypothetical protein
VARYQRAIRLDPKPASALQELVSVSTPVQGLLDRVGEIKRSRAAIATKVERIAIESSRFISEVWAEPEELGSSMQVQKLPSPPVNQRSGRSRSRRHSKQPRPSRPPRYLPRANLPPVSFRAPAVFHYDICHLEDRPAPAPTEQSTLNDVRRFLSRAATKFLDTADCVSDTKICHATASRRDLLA